jgi:hypothetical protein
MKDFVPFIGHCIVLIFFCLLCRQLNDNQRHHYEVISEGKLNDLCHLTQRHRMPVINDNNNNSLANEEEEEDNNSFIALPDLKKRTISKSEVWASFSRHLLDW